MGGPSGLLSTEGILGRESGAPFTGGAAEAVLVEPEGKDPMGSGTSGEATGCQRLGRYRCGVREDNARDHTIRSAEAGCLAVKTGGPSGSRRSFGAEGRNR